MRTTGKMEEAYKQLSLISEQYRQSDFSDTNRALWLLETYADIQRKHSTGEFDECFGLNAFTPVTGLQDHPMRQWKDGPALLNILYEFFPFLVLNSGEQRLDRQIEHQLVEKLVDFPVITDDLIDSLDDWFPHDTRWNGATKPEILAFLLNNAGRRLAAEYR